MFATLCRIVPLGSFLGALEKLRQATVALSCLSVRMEQLGFHWTDFNEI